MIKFGEDPLSGQGKNLGFFETCSAQCMSYGKSPTHVFWVFAGTISDSYKHANSV